MDVVGMGSVNGVRVVIVSEEEGRSREGKGISGRGMTCLRRDEEVREGRVVVVAVEVMGEWWW